MVTPHYLMRLTSETKALRERLRHYEERENAADNASANAAPPKDTGNIPLQDPAYRTTSTTMTVTREEIDAKIALSEQRTETRLAEMSGKVDLMLSKMEALTSAVAASRQDGKDEARHTRQTLWAVAAVIVAIISVGVTLWLGGIDLGGRIGDQVDEKIAASRSIEPARAQSSTSAPEATPAPPQQ